MNEVEQEAVEQLKKLLNDFDNEDISETDLWVINNLIEKQQKELDALDEFIREYGKLQLIPEDENGDIMSARVIFVNNNYISKDKIREKIKEIEKWDKELGKKGENYAITVLKELLEENNND